MQLKTQLLGFVKNVKKNPSVSTSSLGLKLIMLGLADRSAINFEKMPSCCLISPCRSIFITHILSTDQDLY